MYQHKTQFYTIQRSKKSISKELINLCKKSYSVNKKFFKKNIKPIKIIIAETEDEFKTYAGPFYQPWAKGVAREKKRHLVIRNKESHNANYKKYKGTKSREMLLTHEINHIFARQNHLYSGGPYWLTEGLALHIAKQIPNKTFTGNKPCTKKEMQNFLLYRLIMKKLDANMYATQYFALDHLIKKYNMSKIKKLIQSYKPHQTRKEFEQKFKKIFNQGYNSFINEFIKHRLKVQ